MDPTSYELIKALATGIPGFLMALATLVQVLRSAKKADEKVDILTTHTRDIATSTNGNLTKVEAKLAAAEEKIEKYHRTVQENLQVTNTLTLNELKRMIGGLPCKLDIKSDKVPCPENDNRP